MPDFATSRRCSIATLLLLALPILIAKILFRGFAAFPHNDDFLYARCSEILVNDGYYQHVTQHGYLAASVASHCIWGALCCLPFGFSYENLHHSVALIAWIGAVCVWLTSRELGGHPIVSALSAATMLVGPYYFGMSFTFMTDVTAAAFVCLALLGYARGLIRDSLIWLAVGAFGAIMGVWARQTHLIVILVPLIAISVERISFRDFVKQENARRLALKLMVAVGIPILSYVVFEAGLLVPGNADRTPIVDVDDRDLQYLRQLILFGYGGGLLLGLVTVPLLPTMVVQVFRNQVGSRHRFATLISGLVLVMWSSVFVVSQGRAYVTQATGYILYNAHLGPILLGDQNEPGRWSDMGGIQWPSLIWQVITLLCIVSWATVCGQFARTVTPLFSKGESTELRDARASAIVAFRIGLTCCSLACGMALLVLVKMVYDRYWMLCYPMMFVLIGSIRISKNSLNRRGTLFSIGLVVTWCVGSLIFVHDFLAWNDARKRQVDHWLERGLEAKQFDAGNGVNGWLRSAEDDQTHGRPGDRTPFWRGHATEALAIGPRSGWEVSQRIPWRSWAVMRESEILVLRKDLARQAERRSSSPTDGE